MGRVAKFKAKCLRQSQFRRWVILILGYFHKRYYVRAVTAEENENLAVEEAERKKAKGRRSNVPRESGQKE